MIELIGPFHWRLKHLYPCQAQCETNNWHYRKFGTFPACKATASYKYKGKTYCSRHLGSLLIKEQLDTQREGSNP